MRVLLVTHYYPDHRGGIELVAGHLARRLAAAGVHLTWAASRVTPGAGTDGCELLPMPAWNGTEDRLGVPYPVWSPAGLKQLAAAVRSADVVHLHDTLYLGNATAAAAAGRRPVVVTQHVGLVPYRNPLMRTAMSLANRTIARGVLGLAARVVFYATHAHDYFARFVRFRRLPLFVPNGVDTAVFRPGPPERERFGLPADRTLVLFVGRFVEKKGLHVLREVAARRPGLAFAFAGWGPLDPAGWGLPNVFPLGHRSADELAGLYRSADLLALPSVGEGFPLVVQEAMACGCPALVSDETASGQPGAGEWATAVPPTADAVTAALDRMDRTPARRAMVAAHARAAWDWDAVADQYRRLFAGL